MGVNGKWSATMTALGGTWEVGLDLKVDGDHLRGVFVMPPMTPFELEEGTVVGDTLMWATKVDEPVPMTIRFSAVVKGDSITGTLDAGTYGSGEFRGARGEVHLPRPQAPEVARVESGPKWELGCDEWVDALREFVLARLATRDLTGVEFAASWEASDAPSHLRHEGSDIVGWCMTIKDGQVEVGSGSIPDADFKLETDYEHLTALMRMTMAEYIEFMQRDVSRLLENGTFKVHYGDPAKVAQLGELQIYMNWRDDFFSRHTV